MILQELYDVDICIDDLSVFKEPGTVFVSATVAEAICNPVPTCTLNLSVSLDWLDNHSIVDGTKLTFVIKSEKLSIYEKLNFRVFSIRKIEINQKFANLSIEGLIDFYDGYKSGNSFNMYSNSSDLFNQVSKQFNLISEIDQTNDEQLWVAGENNLYQFLMDTANAGWIDETSAMVWCMDRHKILLYKNLTDLFRKRSNDIYTFMQQAVPDLKNKVYEYFKANVSIQSGQENIGNGGYGGSDNYFDVLDYSWKTASAKKVVAESNLININKEVSQGLFDSWLAFNTGNFHPNYYLAKKQNKRILSTYSTYVKLNCQYFMNYRLGQIVNFKFMDGQDLDNQIKLTSGTFMIDAIKINITQRSITTALELMMQGLNGVGNVQETY